MLSALLLVALRPQASPINIYRGAPLGSPNYWDVEDTYLDSSAADISFGGSYTLLAGKGRTVLIKFGDLNRVIGPHKHITSATLFLTPTGGDPPVLKSAGRLLQSWGQGPRTVITNLFAPPPKPGTKPAPLHWASTYKARKAGIASWQSPGALGTEDQMPIKSAHLSAQDKEFAIGGLEEAAQAMLDHPDENYGFAFQFSTSTEFNSSKAPQGTPRLEIVAEDLQPEATADLSVISITSDPAAPKAGDQVTYTATVKNVGKAASQGFTGSWIVNDRPGQGADKKDPLAPGATATVAYQQRFDSSPTDHRVNTLGFKIEPVGPDSCSQNNRLSIYENGIPVNVVIPQELVAKLSETNYLGSQSWEDWVQAQVALWNGTVATQSCFSFAPEGAMERVRVNSLSGTTDSTAAVPADAIPTRSSVTFLKNLALVAGCMDGEMLQIPASKVQVQGSTNRSTVDLFPGLMGYGDTRFEGGIPGPIPFSYDPVYEPSLAGSYFPTTDLLSATDVAGLNKHLDSKPAKPSDNLLPIGKAIILRAVDMQGAALPDTDLLFFQSSGGGIPTGNPAFAVKTNDRGIVVLNSRGAGGPFGDLTPSGDNGVFLVQAKTNGVLETGWIKAWQLSEAYLRGAFTIDLHLNLPGGQVDRTTNLSLDRIVTDSTSDLPAKLAPLIDDDESTSVDLPDTAGSWVDIDLGRDRTIDEVQLVSNGKPMWQRFDIAIYGTGQRVQEGYLWGRELDWSWTSLVRKDLGKNPGSSVIAYRGSPQRVRYIRITNKSGGAGNLSEIRIFPAKIID